MTAFRISTTALLLSTAMTSVAWADVTADQVWDSMETLLKQGGQTELTIGAETREGDTLVISDLVANTKTRSEFTIGENTEWSESNVSMVYDELRFTENGDGTVSVSFPPVLPMVISGSDSDGADFSAKIESRTTDLTMLVKDAGDDRLALEASASEMALELMEAPSDSLKLVGANKLTGRNMTATYVMQAGDTKDIILDGEATVKDMTIEVNLNALEEGQNVTIGGGIDSVTATADLFMPHGVDYEDPSAMFASGFKVSGRYELTGSRLNALITDEEGDSRVTLSEGATSFDFAMDGAAVSFDATSKDSKGDITVAQMPFPIHYELSELGTSFEMPLSASSEPSRAALSFTAADLSVNDEIWSLFDPQKVLPRTPVTVRAALSGMVQMLVNIYDEETFENADIPAVPLSAQIDALEINAVGLTASGTGAVEFDINDMESFDGMPAPVGSVSIDAAGVNGLIDNLITMGIVPEDQAMMTRMMIGMFAKATGEDALNSTIEFKPGGKIYANGQQIR